MIATSKFARSQQRDPVQALHRGHLRSHRVRGEGRQHLPRAIDGPRRLQARREKPLVLVITSDRGLCGPYNGSILRRDEAPAASTTTTSKSSGRSQSVLRVQQVQHRRRPQPVRRQADLRRGRELARQYMDRFAAGEITSVHVVYAFISTARWPVRASPAAEAPAVEHAEERPPAPAASSTTSPRAGGACSPLLPDRQGHAVPGVPRRRGLRERRPHGGDEGRDRQRRRDGPPHRTQVQPPARPRSPPNSLRSSRARPSNRPRTKPELANRPPRWAVLLSHPLRYTLNAEEFVMPRPCPCCCALCLATAPGCTTDSPDPRPLPCSLATPSSPPRTMRSIWRSPAPPTRWAQRSRFRGPARPDLLPGTLEYRSVEQDGSR